MSKSIFPWVKPLGLSSSNFSEKPENADALIWGLKNNVINAEDYLEWASEFYRCPAIRAEFFSMAVDFSLKDKYAEMYDWYTYCYPIYQWEGTLFVACLQPPTENLSGKFCFVIAPFHALESAWQKHENSKAGIPMPTEQLVIFPEPSNGSPQPEMTSTEVLSQKNSFESLDVDLEIQDLNATREQTVTPPPVPGPEDWEVKSPQQPPVAKPPDLPPPVAKKISNPQAEAMSLDFADLKNEMGLSDLQPPAKAQPQNIEEAKEVGELDFSSMEDGALSVSNDHQDDDGDQHIESAEEDADQPAHEITQTKADLGLNNLTSATQTMHYHNQTMTGTNGHTKTPPLPFDNMTIKDLSLEGELTEVEPPKEEKTKLSPAASRAQGAPQKPPVKVGTPPPVEAKAKVSDENCIPSLEIFEQHKTENPSMAPGLEQSDISLEKENRPSIDGVIDDDYTPVPILTKAQKEAQDRRRKELIAKEKAEEQSKITENTITDHAQPILIPAENLISDADLKAATNLDNSQTMKDVMAHIFNHLRRDYTKLMWVEGNGENQYFVKYVYGDWKITELAWKMHINITNPNIFRVAYKSGHPFHGDISSNPYNDKYFEWWNRGKTPNFGTVFPVTVNETIIGFISCFGMNQEFDEVGSLKKIENLITICRKALANFKSAKAA